jgi:hypothetical protein
MTPLPLVLVVTAALVSCTDAMQAGESPDVDAGAGTDGSTDPAGDPGCDVPITDIRAYLDQGTYRQFPAEPAVHRSTGPHGGNVRTYLNPSLHASLAARAAEHPRCAAAVKELYGGGTATVTGWAVGVKTAAGSDRGAAWYWYEVTSTRPGASPVADGKGVPLCSGCHASGTDYVLTPPLAP